MLVLSRKTQQSIYIGDDVVVSILGVRGGKVQVGIEAPQDKRILRCEIAKDQIDWLPSHSSGDQFESSSATAAPVQMLD